MLSNDKRSKEFDRLDCWRHSLATAIGARIIAKYKMPSRAEEMYTAGLLHDVGLLVFDKFCPDKLDQAIRLSVKDRSPLHVAVFDTFGYHQGQVGALLCLKWGLSKMIHTAILNHYDPKADPNDLESACILSASNALAFECGCYNNSPSSDEGFDDSIVGILGFPQDQFLPICEMVRAEVDKAQSSFVPLKRAA